MYKMKKQKGITLIALIITIVILLILAIVTIGAVQESGIIGHAQDASSKYTIAQEKEQIGLALSEYQIQKTLLGSAASFANIITSELRGIADVTDNGDDKLTVTFPTGNVYTVTEDGTIDGPLKSAGEGEESGEGGDVVTPPDDEEDTPPQTDMPVATVGTKTNENSTIDGQMYSSTNPIIPAGFTAINTDTSSWDAESGPEVDNGLVISDDEGNEFVWVPVTTNIDLNGKNVGTTENREPDVVTQVKKAIINGLVTTYEYVDGADKDSTNLEIAGCVENLEDDDEVITESDFKEQLTKEYKAMVGSVNEYNGFYVGRYETSNNSGVAQSKSSSSIASTSNGSTWYALYALNKTYSTSSVQGSMIWGTQYDAMMTWMEEAADATIPLSETDVIKNVYSLCGNYHEYTLEASETIYRLARGGTMMSPAAPRTYVAYGPTGTTGYYGSRLAIYIVD